MKKYFFLIISAIGLISLIAAPAFAHCPLCTAATGAAVAVTRFYGVSDAIAGLWIGAFIVSTALWFNKMLKKEYVPFQGAALTGLALLLTVVPFYFSGLIGNAYNKIFGIDKLLFGIILGSAVTQAGIYISEAIKEKRNGTLFPFQSIVLILAFLTAATLAFQYGIKFF